MNKKSFLRILGGMILSIQLFSPWKLCAQTNSVPLQNGGTSGDEAAAKFALSCAGCHSLTGIKLKGPDLGGVVSWSIEDLKVSIKKMEKNVGSLKEIEIDLLTQFLKDPTAATRLKAEQEKVAKMYAAKLDPPSATRGAALFNGKIALKNGGLACIACHAAQAKGGQFGPDLTTIYSKMGETPLISAIEKTSFKVMEPAYRHHPVTKQEALHLTRYLSTLDARKEITIEQDFATIGGVSGLIVFFGMSLFYKKNRRNRPQPLKRRRS